MSINKFKTPAATEATKWINTGRKENNDSIFELGSEINNALK